MHAGHAQDAVGLRHAKVAARMIELALATRMEVQKIHPHKYTRK